MQKPFLNTSKNWNNRSSFQVRYIKSSEVATASRNSAISREANHPNIFQANHPNVNKGNWKINSNAAIHRNVRSPYHWVAPSIKNNPYVKINKPSISETKVVANDDDDDKIIPKSWKELKKKASQAVPRNNFKPTPEEVSKTIKREVKNVSDAIVKELE